jgi:peptidoglycan/xylan/chitin deacetylase (PgdA/CDA1 family)
MPPGFWELYDGSATAGVTVHFVEDKLDAGDVIGSREFTIHKNETESSLRYKLDLEGSRLLAECVDAVRQGTAAAIPQPQYSGKPRTIPSHRQREELRRRIPQAPQETGLRQLAKTVVHLSLYYGGVYSAVRGWRSLTRRSRAVVLLYHRVNDFSDDALTVSTERFAEHLSLFREKYELRSTSWLVDALRSGTRIPPRTLVIQFDDCYADVLHQGGQLLRAWDMPATAFIASGYVGTNRVFEHDAKKYPFQYPNFTPDEVRSLPACGFEVGAHTVNHVNLGEVSLEDAQFEVTESRLQLEAILGRQVRFFSFPWGRLHNIREEIRPIVRSAGYDAMFAADGGFVAGSTDLYDIPRCGASSKHRPLDLMMELEGLSSCGIVGRLRRLLRPYRKAVGASGEQPVAQQAAETTAE